MDKVTLKLGPFVTMQVVVKTATEDDSKDTALKTLCTGKPGGETHDPVRVNGLMRCTHTGCEREERSYHPFPRGRDNGDGTFTVLSAEQLAAAAVDRALVETIDLTKSPVEQVEAESLPVGRLYWLAPGKGAEKTYDTFVKTVRNDTGFAYMSMYARSTAPASYRILAIGDLLALQEIATGEKLKQRPAVNVAEASDTDVAMLTTLSAAIECEYKPENFADTRKAVIAAALAATEASEAGEEVALATVTQLPTPSENPFAVAMRAAGLDPDAVTVVPAEPKKRTSKKAEDAPPVQPLPSEVPGNVDTTLVSPKKRAPRKATAKSA